MIDILSLKNWTVLRTDENNNLVIDAEYDIQPTACLKCGSPSFYKHGPKPVTYRDSPVRGLPVVINAVLKRYRCLDCGSTFIQPVTGIHSEMRMTVRCVSYIQSQCLKDTFTRIAENIGCDDKTIRSITQKYIQQLNENYNPELLGWIGIDETKIDGKQRFVITDIINRKPVEMLTDRESNTVSNWLWKHRHDDVKGFAMDMWRPYKKIINEIFPNIPIVVDKFHVVRMANQAMDSVRITLAKDQQKSIGKDWMRKKSLLRMRYKDLDEHGKYNVDMWLANEPSIAIAHGLKELFYSIYDQTNRDDAEAILDEWIAIVPSEMKRTTKDFKPLLTAVKNWREEILAYFDFPISNGYTEALNGVAKVINRQGRGYNFETLRARLLFNKYRKPPYPSLRMDIDEEMTAREFVDLLENLIRCECCLRLLTPFDYSAICVTCVERFPHLKPYRYPPLPVEDSTLYSE
jgi:transposase